MLQRILRGRITFSVQMIGTHHAATRFLALATIEGQTFEGMDANVLRATRLMRLFTEQLEALAKLKGKAGQQRVVVEHVKGHHQNTSRCRD